MFLISRIFGILHHFRLDEEVQKLISESKSAKIFNSNDCHDNTINQMMINKFYGIKSNFVIQSCFC